MRSGRMRWGVLFAALAAGQVWAEVRVGDVPPDRVGLSHAGVEVALSGHRGKVVVTTFWASWCGPCLKELPMLARVRELVGQDRLEIVAINFKEEPRTFRRFAEALAPTGLTMVHDRRGALADAYGVKTLPHMFIIDHTGTVAHVHRGYGDETLDRFVDEINALLVAQEAARTAVP